MTTEVLELLELLLAGAPREELDAVVARSAAPEAQQALALARRIHDRMRRQQGREAELSALYETART